MSAEIIRELTEDDGFRGEAALVRVGEEHFVVSDIDGETIAYRSTEQNKITHLVPVAGGLGKTQAEVITELETEGASAARYLTGAEGKEVTEAEAEQLEEETQTTMALMMLLGLTG